MSELRGVSPILSMLLEQDFKNLNYDSLFFIFEKVIEEMNRRKEKEGN